MKSAIIMISRDRTKLLCKTMPYWSEQELPLTIMTEPDQVHAYRNALDIGGWSADVVAHPEPDKGVGWARVYSLALAEERGLTSYVLADDDTTVRRGDDVRKLIEIVERAQVVCCGGWLSVHGLWYGLDVAGRKDRLVPHNGDKVFAVNVELARKVGGFDPIPWDVDTPEFNRICVRAGYMWWIHSGVFIKERAPVKAAGGIAAYGQAIGQPREAQRELTHAYLYEKWGPRYISKPGTPYRTFVGRMILDYVGQEAFDIYLRKKSMHESDDLPYRETGSIQLEMGVA